MKIINSLNEELTILKAEKKIISNPYHSENTSIKNTFRSFSQNNVKSSKIEKSNNF